MKTPELRNLLEQLADFDTALLANTIGYVDPTPPEHYYMGGSIHSVTPTLGPTVGVAVTCEMDSSSPRNKPEIGGYWQQLQQMQDAGVPTVWVVKCVGSRPDHECVNGDGMAKTLGWIVFGGLGLILVGWLIVSVFGALLKLVFYLLVGAAVVGGGLYVMRRVRSGII